MNHVLILSDTHHIVKSLSLLIQTEASLHVLDATRDVIGSNMDQLPDNSVIIVDMNVDNIELLIEKFPEKYRVILYSGSLELMDIPIHLQSTGCRYFNAYTSPEEIIKILMGCV
ncbi:MULTISPECIES: hypothetical protein [unclassified Paenibacillus]|uniref:hypothetical protein n=1 Tax=unclassified Paenibacillus TaxID=185978 RepID=UPI0009A55F4B|nr:MULTISPECIES: hypothetical protein [unclassified Paenibacillus]SLK10054.1 hypothetical protein SAMN06272722_106240 [Paenibacillus sp. RU5A]SOC71840.1 hypothetical protein SAMN05880581_106240 [Paenibacillus sp. RU26A]SOC74195.1 hypothetical protein SAMN05880586_106240 [Paenibacillus sp. RU5M]